MKEQENNGRGECKWNKEKREGPNGYQSKGIVGVLIGEGYEEVVWKHETINWERKSEKEESVNGRHGLKAQMELLC